MKIDDLKTDTKKSLQALGFNEFSQVQNICIPLALKHENIVVKSQTGTGKTHAFLIPIFEMINSSVDEVFAVIVSPTRELAMQIYQMASQINEYRHDKIEIKLFTGGTDRNKEIKYLENHTPQIVIATPGKLYDLGVKEKILSVYQTKVFVVDEADMAFDGGFIEQMHQIASLMPKKLQMMTFSATMNKELEHFLNKYMYNPKFININEKQLTNTNIEHVLLKTKYHDKFNLFVKLTSIIRPYLCLVFCNTKNSSEKLYAKMKNEGFNVCLINGNQPQRIRKQVMRRIKNLDYTYIVATDIAARGIDIDDVSHVINYELPNDVEFYVHRSGRTARQAKDGICISFYEFENYEYLDKLESLGVAFTFKDIKNNELVSTKTRNERKRRVVVDETLKKAKKRVISSKKVKPGYKKKYQERLANEVKRLKKQNRKKG